MPLDRAVSNIRPADAVPDEVPDEAPETVGIHRRAVWTMLRFPLSPQKLVRRSAEDPDAMAGSNPGVPTNFPNQEPIGGLAGDRYLRQDVSASRLRPPTHRPSRIVRARRIPALRESREGDRRCTQTRISQALAPRHSRGEGYDARGGPVAVLPFTPRRRTSRDCEAGDWDGRAAARRGIFPVFLLEGRMTVRSLGFLLADSARRVT
jgi:hypothetical protein